MSLLVDMMRDAQDPAYAAARQREQSVAEPGGHSSRRRALAGAGVLLVLGVATGAAAAQLRRGADDAEATRLDLVSKVRERTSDSDGLARDAASLRREVDALRTAGLARGTAGRAQSAALAAVQLAAGQTAVAGPGVVVTIDDRPDEEKDGGLDRGGQLGEGRVQDRDLQILVNGLWAAGAEAISVNDLRLTVRTAIRSAGEAVLVDFRPLSPPYVVRAIGRPGRLQPDFTDSEDGRRVATNATVNGLPFSIRAEDALRLPAGNGADLGVARPGS
jgi:uncharacterized protein YlxW (UPF0749 family)